MNNLLHHNKHLEKCRKEQKNLRVCYIIVTIITFSGEAWFSAVLVTIEMDFFLNYPHLYCEHLVYQSNRQ